MRNSIYMLLLWVPVLTAANSFAQQITSQKRFQFHSVDNVGLLEGQAGSAFQLETVNGLQYKSWFSGIGIGLDFYRYRTIPLFIDLRKEFGKASNKFFVYGDAGMNFYWKRDKDVKQFYIDDKMKNGFYAEAGAGYKFRLNPKMKLMLSCGYSYKKLTETGGSYYFYPIDPPFMPPAYAPEKINYTLNRLVLKAGIEF